MSLRSRQSGFTLIELLTVIAIIAILAAILFPVVASVREQARQGSCMSNLHQIYVAAQVYRQDEGAFPPALFGHPEHGSMATGVCDPTVSTGISFNPAVNACVANADRILYGFLYREQMKDINNFRCPDNVNRPLRDVTIAHYPPHPPEFGHAWYIGDSGEIGVACPTTPAGYVDCYRRPEVTTADPRFGRPKYYYIWDSYDIGPRIDQNGNAVMINGQRIYDKHYSTAWTDNRGLTDMTIQMQYQAPPSDRTLLTYCTWHVAIAGSSSVPAINLAGTARKIDAKQMYRRGANVFNR